MNACGRRTFDWDLNRVLFGWPCESGGTVTRTGLGNAPGNTTFAELSCWYVWSSAVICWPEVAFRGGTGRIVNLSGRVMARETAIACAIFASTHGALRVMQSVADNDHSVFVRPPAFHQGLLQRVPCSGSRRTGLTGFPTV
jgi:hypothetical protein